MCRFKIVVFILLFFATLNKSFAQSQKIDSLIITLQKTKTDTAKVKLLCELSLQSILTGNYNDGLQYANKALQLSDKIKYIDGKKLAFKRIGYNYFSQSDYAKALENYLSSLKLSQFTNDKRGIASVYMNIGQVYGVQKDLDKAIFYFNKSLESYNEAKYDNDLGDLYMNIGNVYISKSEFDKALEYYQNAIKYAEKYDDIYLKLMTLGNIGAVYSYKEEHHKALDIYFEALHLRDSLGDKKGVELNLGNIGLAYASIDQYENAEGYIKKALNISKEINDLHAQMDLNLSLSKIFSAQNKWDKAHEYYTRYSELKDSIYNETKSRQIAEMQTKYELAEKEKELELIRSEKKFETYKNYSISGGIILITIILLLIINRRLAKAKRENEMYQIQQKFDQGEIERNKLERENLQSSLLLNEEKLNKITSLFREKSKLMDKMQEQLDDVKKVKTEQKEIQDLLSTIEEYIDPNQYWEEFITSFNLVNKNFFNQLSTEFPNLTRSELRLCALIKCSLGNKEIANILNITPDSVKKSKTRLRKKLQLEVDENLTKYIFSLN